MAEKDIMDKNRDSVPVCNGTSCVNNPYYIGDQTQIMCVARIQIYIGCFA